MKNKNKERLLLISTICILTLSGCSKEEKEQATKELEETTGVIKEQIEEIVSKTIIEEEQLKINDEKTAVEYFQNQEEYTEDEYVDRLTEHTKSAVDFIFNDQPLNEIYFKDLTEEAKLEILESVEKTNTFLEETGIKEIAIISGGKAIDFSLEVMNESIEISKVVLKEWLTEEQYNKASELKEDAEEKLNDTIDAVKEYIKNKK